MLPGMVTSARAASKTTKTIYYKVEYQEASWNADYGVTYQLRAIPFCEEIDSETKTLEYGAYFVQHNTVNTNRITVKGSVDLILCDGATLEAKAGITVGKGATLNIYGQTKGTGTLIVDSHDSKSKDTGGLNVSNGGAVNIHGGTVIGIGNTGGAAIGGANGNGGVVNHYGGVAITAANVDPGTQTETTPSETGRDGNTATTPGGQTSTNEPTAPDDAPSEEKTPTAEFVKFPDLDANEWYADAVAWALGDGVMIGADTGEFLPDTTATRATVALMLWRMEGSPACASTDAFDDVASTDWYSIAVNWASAAGIVQGFDGSFYPEEAVSREQLATMLYRYAQYKNADISGYAELGGFADVESVSTYADAALHWAVGSGILKGRDNMLLSPLSGGTRAEVAHMLHCFCDAVAA